MSPASGWAGVRVRVAVRRRAPRAHEQPARRQHGEEREGEQVQLPGAEHPGGDVRARGDEQQAHAARGGRAMVRLPVPARSPAALRRIASSVSPCTLASGERMMRWLSTRPARSLMSWGTTIVASAQHGQRLGGAHQRDAGARARAEVDLPAGARGGEQVDHVARAGRPPRSPRPARPAWRAPAGAHHRLEVGEGVARPSGPRGCASSASGAG